MGITVKQRGYKMLLKDAAKVINDKIDSEIDLLPNSEKTDMSIFAMKTGKGYILGLSANGKTMAIISSKREDRRVFKTLDAISRALHDVEINWFEVFGTK